MFPPEASGRGVFDGKCSCSSMLRPKPYWLVTWPTRRLTVGAVKKIIRTPLCIGSAISRLPLGSKATSVGSKVALMPGPPSPSGSLPPRPAIVVIIPVESILRTRWLPLSAMKMLPALSMAILTGPESCACVACPPSPMEPLIAPVPAMVVITPAGWVVANFHFRGFTLVAGLSRGILTVPQDSFFLHAGRSGRPKPKSLEIRKSSWKFESSADYSNKSLKI